MKLKKIKDFLNELFFEYVLPTVGVLILIIAAIWFEGYVSGYSTF